MPDFYHAPTCPCGNCRAESPDEPVYHSMPCGCQFDNGEMSFCPKH